MKKIILFIFVFSFSYYISAQEKSFSGGLFVGPGISWLGSDSKSVAPDGIKIGYSFGAIFDFYFDSNFAFATGLQFNNYGGKIKYHNGAASISWDNSELNRELPDNSELLYRLNYLAVPLGFKGKTNEIGYVSFFLKAGFTPMINIKSKADFGENKKELIGDETRLFNLGWHIGGGIEITVTGNTRLLVEILYNRGLFDIDKTKVYTSALKDNNTNPKILLNDLGLRVGFLF
jgi:opacity protein-like surface antigen